MESGSNGGCTQQRRFAAPAAASAIVRDFPNRVAGFPLFVAIPARV